MCGSSRCLRISVLFLSSIGLLAVAWRGAASADDSANYVLTEDALNKTLGALSDLRSKGLPISVGGDSLESEIANLKKQPKVAKIIKKRGLSLREFVLTYKSAAQIREAEKRQRQLAEDPGGSERDASGQIRSYPETRRVAADQPVYPRAD